MTRIFLTIAFLLASISYAAPHDDSEGSKHGQAETKVFRGKLVSMVGIGGETTGYGLDLGLKPNGDGTYHHESIEIEPGDFKDSIKKLIDSETEVELTGYFTLLKGGVERPTIKAFKVTDLQKVEKSDEKVPKKEPVEDSNEGRITRKAPKADKAIETGLNGVLKWKKGKDESEFLALESPSGKIYPLVGAGASLRRQLESLAEKEKHVEIFGSLKLKGGGEAEFKPTEIESSDSGSRGQFIVGIKEGLSDEKRKEIIDAFESIPTTKVIRGDDKHLVVRTDLSEKSLNKRIGK